MDVDVESPRIVHVEVNREDLDAKVDDADFEFFASPKPQSVVSTPQGTMPALDTPGATNIAAMSIASPAAPTPYSVVFSPQAIPDNSPHSFVETSPLNHLPSGTHLNQTDAEKDALQGEIMQTYIITPEDIDPLYTCPTAWLPISFPGLDDDTHKENYLPGGKWSFLKLNLQKTETANDDDADMEPEPGEVLEHEEIEQTTPPVKPVKQITYKPISATISLHSLELYAFVDPSSFPTNLKTWDNVFGIDWTKLHESAELQLAADIALQQLCETSSFWMHKSRAKRNHKWNISRTAVTVKSVFKALDSYKEQCSHLTLDAYYELKGTVVD
jgi:hypothetical protein